MSRSAIGVNALLVCLCLLTACGFQLRGSAGSAGLLPEAWQSMALVTGNQNSEFSREVQTRFTANGVTWTERDSASYQLALGSEQFKQRNLSLNTEARAAEFELTLSASFSVFDAEHREVMPRTTVSVTKQMENDPRNVVGKAEEIRLLRQEMRAELAQQIVRRVVFFSTSAEGAAGTAAEAGAGAAD